MTDYGGMTIEEMAAAMNSMLDYGMSAEEIAANPLGALEPYLDEYVRAKRLELHPVPPKEEV